MLGLYGSNHRVSMLVWSQYSQWAMNIVVVFAGMAATVDVVGMQLVKVFEVAQ